MDCASGNLFCDNYPPVRFSIEFPPGTRPRFMPWGPHVSNLERHTILVQPHTNAVIACLRLNLL